MRSLLAALGLASAALLHAQAPPTPTWTAPPKLVVGIVVDQMRTDYLYRYWDNFGEKGFKRLVREGSFQRDAHYEYVPTFTGPGHASIYTGTTPADHGIVSNDRYDRALRHTVYCAEDTLMRGVGTSAASARKSPAQLLATTLADELELRTDRRARTVGVALKDRSAIMPIGRMGDAAYWFVGGKEGNFVSSSWYMKELPAWVGIFNARHLPEHYLARTWEASLPRERYHAPLPDGNPYEIPLAPGLPATLPVDLDSLRKAGAGLELIGLTPWGNTLTTDMALAAIDGEALGQDAVTDLLAVSYSSPDMLGHRVGPRAIEEEDMYIRLDGEIARLLTHLDKVVGAGAYTVFLTADHGASDVPAFLRDLKGSAGYVPVDELKKWLVDGGCGAWVDTLQDGQVYLTEKAGAEAAAQIARRLAAHPYIASALTADELRERRSLTGPARAMALGFMPQRCGDVLYILRPGFFEFEPGLNGKGTTHGSAWNYDTHVPVLFFGRGVVPGEVLRRTSITDIAPTVSAIVGMALPNAASGMAVPEVVRTR